MPGSPTSSSSGRSTSRSWPAALEADRRMDAAAASGAAELFRLLAEDVDALLDERQRAAVEYALATS
jgi:hypothetical protein